MFAPQQHRQSQEQDAPAEKQLPEEAPVGAPGSDVQHQAAAGSGADPATGALMSHWADGSAEESKVRPRKEDYQAPEPLRLKWLQDQRRALLAMVKAGQLDARTAIIKAARYDEHINSGKPSPEGAEMIASLGLELSKIAAEQPASEPTPQPLEQQAAAPQPQPAPQPQAQEAPAPRPQEQQAAAPQPQAEQAQAPQPQAEQAQGARPLPDAAVKALGGGLDGGALKDQPTTPAEAKILNDVRGKSKRFDATWLMKAQGGKLGMAAASGSFDTETLRAMQSFAGHPLSAGQIYDVNFLQSIEPGDPFLQNTTLNTHGNQAADPSATTPADRTAQHFGFANYRKYQDTWTDIKLLDIKLGRGTTHLASRLSAATAYLRARHADLKSDEEIRGAIGWNGQGNASYDTSASDMKAHVHTMGIAIDIDKMQNPWIFRGKTTHTGDEADDWYEKLFTYAQRIYGGTALTAKKLGTMGSEQSTKEIHEQVSGASNAVEKYLALCLESEDVRRTTLEQAGFEASEIKSLLPRMKKHHATYHSGDRRQEQAKGLTNIGLEMLIALRDVAGLAWGGTDFPGGNQEGDFMHFDCRTDGWGGQVTSVGAAAMRNAGVG